MHPPPPELLTGSSEYPVIHSISTTLQQIWVAGWISHPPFSHGSTCRCVNRSIEAALFPVVPTPNQLEVIKEVPPRYNGRVRKLVLDLLLDQLRAIELELLEEFPAPVSAPISAVHNHYGFLDSSDRSVGLGDLQRTFLRRFVI